MMRGASADALAALTDELAGSLGGSSGSGDAARIGDDLFTVAQMLRSEPGLRRVATDASIPAEAKQGLVEQIFSGQASDTALALVRSAVGRRWTSARDLADALERVSEQAVVRSAGSDTARLTDELFAVGQAVKHNPELRDALANPQRSAEDKASLVDSLLSGKALAATVTLVKQALAGSYRTVAAALAEYQKVAAAVHDESVATVRTAQPLADHDRDRLAAALARHYGRDVHLNVVVEPHLIGGLRVELGDDVIDGSVASRLDDARRRLAG